MFARAAEEEKATSVLRRWRADKSRDKSGGAWEYSRER